MKYLSRWLSWLILLLVWGAWVAWPVTWAMTADFLTGRHFVLLTNEAEARPCGGFVTAFGEAQIFPPKFSLQNAYALESHTFGMAPDPLGKVADDWKFWDLGTDADVGECAKKFHDAARKANLGEFDRVIFLDLGTAETVLRDPGFFAKMTRQVANVDRHDEQSLSERKSPLATLGKKMIVRTIFAPWRWGSMTRLLNDAVQHGDLWIEGVSPDVAPGTADLAVVEWNLGGGKSSRMLAKHVEISLRETAPDEWRWSGRISAEHLGSWDEPLSVTWKGVIELRMPDFAGGDTLAWPIELEPGQKWSEHFDRELEGQVQIFGVWRQRSAELTADVRIALYGQQTFENQNFAAHENVARWIGTLETPRQSFSWHAAEDTVAPFVTLHEWLSMEDVPEELREKWDTNFATSSRRWIVTEVHFSEPVDETDQFRVVLRDKNVENPDTNPSEFGDSWLNDAGTTMVIGWWQEGRQVDERYALQFSGLVDGTGNKIDGRVYTVIDR